MRIRIAALVVLGFCSVATAQVANPPFGPSTTSSGGGGGSSTLTANSTVTSGFTAGQYLYSDGSKLQAGSFGIGIATALGLTLNGSGAISATTSPTFVTPALGVASATSLAIGAGSAITSSGAGGALGSNAFTSTAYLPLSAGSGNSLTGALFDTQSIGATSTDGAVLQNTTAAAVGAQQWSPRLHLLANVWNTTATTTKVLDWIMEVQPVQGTTSVGSALKNNLVLSAQTDAAGFKTMATFSQNANSSNLTLGDSGAGTIVNVLPGNDGSGTLGSVSFRWANIFGFGNLTLNGAASNVITVNVTASGTVKTGGYTVATLPSGTVGMKAYVTDQLTACVAAGLALTGGGGVTCPVFYNGSAWVGD